MILIDNLLNRILTQLANGSLRITSISMRCIHVLQCIHTINWYIDVKSTIKRIHN